MSKCDTNKITKREINKMTLRCFWVQNSHNYERMISLGILYSMTPILEKLYTGRPKEECVRAQQRHLEYFNTMPMMVPFILGLAASIEENTAEDEKNSVIAIKTSLMGPLAGLGDSLLNFTLFPIAGSIGASFAIQGNFIGPIIMFILINIVYMPLRLLGGHLGYRKGNELLSSDKGKETLNKISTMASVLGVMITASLISNTVKTNIGLVFGEGDGAIKVQAMLDNIMPGLIPLGIVLLCFYFLRKWQGKYIVSIIFTIIIISIVLSYFGILI